MKGILLKMLITALPMVKAALQPNNGFRFPFRVLVGSSRSMTSVAEEGLRTLEAGSHMAEIEVKKSRFLGYAKHVENWKEAQDYIEGIKIEHPKARHWCFGMVCGVNPVQERSSDDGEPTGTAGAPILGAIKGENLVDTVCVVVRYFGGIKLGAGGLIRAYGSAARSVLRDAPVVITLPSASFRLNVDTTYVGSVYEMVAKLQATTSDEEYAADGSFSVTLTCDLSNADALRENIKDSTKGTVRFEDQ